MIPSYLLIVLALPAISAYSYNIDPRTNPSHRPFELNYTSKLLIDADKVT